MEIGIGDYTSRPKLNQASAKKITGVFVSLHRAPLRVVFRRPVDYRREIFEAFRPSAKIDAVCEVIRTLSAVVEDFGPRILSIDEAYYRNSPHRTRRYIHTDRTELYQGRSDLMSYSHKVGELWIGTNLNASGMLHVIREACEAAEVEYGPLGAIKW